MIRVVLDTNVIISALLTPAGTSAAIVGLAAAEAVILCLSAAVFAEYEEVLARFRLGDEGDIASAALEGIRRNAVWVKVSGKLTVCSDPDDDIFLECAVAAKADYLVTGNLRHFPRLFEGTRIVTPREFLNIFPA